MTTFSNVWINGSVIPSHRASISIYDRGFLFGDALYEVIPIYYNQSFLLESHLLRLEEGLKKARIPSVYTIEQWHETAHTLIKNNMEQNTHAYLYIQITRGAPPIRTHTPDTTTPNHIAMLFPFTPPTNKVLEQGIKTCIHEDIRWQRRDIKSTSLMANIMMNQYAQDHNTSETLLHDQGILTEGSRSNVFILKENTLYTPFAHHNILSGVTREHVFSLAKKCSIPLIEKDITLETLYDADEVWITSATREIMPVSHIDEHHFHTAGPVWQKLYRAFHTTLPSQTASLSETV